MDTTTATYHSVSPVYGSMIHVGLEMPFERIDGSKTTISDTLCSVTVKYRPGTSPSMSREEAVSKATCPRCLKVAARVDARRAAVAAKAGA